MIGVALQKGRRIQRGDPIPCRPLEGDTPPGSMSSAASHLPPPCAQEPLRPSHPCTSQAKQNASHEWPFHILTAVQPPLLTGGRGLIPFLSPFLPSCMMHGYQKLPRPLSLYSLPTTPTLPLLHILYR